jgi:hypothetical protein
MSIIDGIKDMVKGKKDEPKPNNPVEDKMLSEIISNQQAAETKRADIETTWEDEYKSFKGDQWDLSFARRSNDAKKIRPNSVDNFIFGSIMGLHSQLTATTPEATLEVSDGDESTDDTELSKKLTDVVANVLDKNKFQQLWKKIVLRGISHGPFIGAVLWDNDWIGGVGPNRWVGEVKIIAQKKEEIYFDPAILDLEERLQECSFIHRRMRKKLSYFKSKWEKGIDVNVDENEDEDEGVDHNQAWLIESWHKGKPKYIPADVKKDLLQKAMSFEAPSVTVDKFKAEKYRLMAEGKIDGVHVAYVTQNVVLEYVPYCYEDGLYPFVYKVMYTDAKSPYGFGEIRNVMIPQVMHNKADEIEIEAMSVEGLGGAYYTNGAITPKQLAFITQNSAKGGMWAEVNNVNQIKPREGARVPASISNYRAEKKATVETISKNTAIRQGVAPKGNLPFKAIAELGARTDVSTKGVAETLEDFQRDLILLVVNRIKEFYTEERAYKIRNQKESEPQQVGTFSNKEMTRQWEREPASIDADGYAKPPSNESYMPDFTAKVKIIDERPTDRNYYIQFAMNLLPMQMIDAETFWDVIEEGKFPPKEIILERMQKKAQEAAQAQMQAQGMQQQQQNEQAQLQHQRQLQLQQAKQPQQQGTNPAQVEEFIKQLPEEVLQVMDKMHEQERLMMIAQMMKLNPEQLQQFIGELMGGGQNG